MYPLPTNIAKEFERLDKSIVHLMHTADKRCRRKNKLCKMFTKLQESDEFIRTLGVVKGLI